MDSPTEAAVPNNPTISVVFQSSSFIILRRAMSCGDCLSSTRKCVLITLNMLLMMVLSLFSING